MSGEIFKFISNNEYPDSANKARKIYYSGRASNYVFKVSFQLVLFKGVLLSLNFTKEKKKKKKEEGQLMCIIRSNSYTYKLKNMLLLAPM